MGELKKAIYNRFKKHGATWKMVNESVWKGDPYGWSSGAFATISTEKGLPSSAYEALEDWCELNDDLAPHGLFAECVNAAVVAVYKD